MTNLTFSVPAACSRWVSCNPLKWLAGSNGLHAQGKCAARPDSQLALTFLFAPEWLVAALRATRKDRGRGD